jgi:hypothetical protein
VDGAGLSDQPVVFRARNLGQPFAVLGGWDHDLKLAAQVDDRTGKDLVRTVRQARYAGHVRRLVCQGRPDGRVD